MPAFDPQRFQNDPAYRAAVLANPAAYGGTLPTEGAATSENKGDFSRLISRPFQQLPVLGGVTPAPAGPAPSFQRPTGPGIAEQVGTALQTQQQQTQAASEKSQGEAYARQITARRLELLRQMLMGGQERGIQGLRRQLAQRGMLDSGSLGAGVTDIIGQTQGRLAEGTQAAAIGESETLLDMLKREQDRQFASQQMAKQLAAQQQMMQLQAQLSKQNQPSGFESFLGGLGGAAAGGLGASLPFFLFPSLFKQDDER